MSVRVRLAEQQSGEEITATNEPTDRQADTDDNQNEARDSTELQDSPFSFREKRSKTMELRKEEEMQEIDVKAPSAEKYYRPTGIVLFE